jgi:hypothetical protein
VDLLFPDVALVVLNSVSFQKAHYFVLKRLLSMVLLLLGDVARGAVKEAEVDGDAGICLLPCKFSEGWECLLQPETGMRLYTAYGIRDRYGLVKAGDHVNVIVHASDGYRHGVVVLENAAHVTPKSRAYVRFKPALALLRAEDDVIVQA